MFVQIIGKGHINVNNVVMVSSKNDEGKYMVTLSHGGKIIVTQKVRDDIFNAHLKPAERVMVDKVVGVDPKLTGKKRSKMIDIGKVTAVSELSAEINDEVKSDE